MDSLLWRWCDIWPVEHVGPYCNSIQYVNHTYSKLWTQWREQPWCFLHGFPVLPFLRCHVDLKHIHASAVLNHSRMNSSCNVLPPPSLSLSLSLTTFSLCCWLGSVLGSTCPQNEYTFACISALPWLACYPLCRRVWLMIRVCHFSQQLSRPPARAHIKHPNEGKKKPRNFIFYNKNEKHMLAYVHNYLPYVMSLWFEKLTNDWMSTVSGYHILNAVM